MSVKSWTIAELRQRYIISDEEYSLDLRSAYPDSAVVTTDDVLLSTLFPPRVCLSLATKLSGIGGRKFKNFAVDCAVHLLHLLTDDTPGLDEAWDCVAHLRAYIDQPTKEGAKEVRLKTGELEAASHPNAGTTYRDRLVRSACAHILGLVGRCSGRIQREGPQKYEPFSPRECAGLAGSSAARAAGDYHMSLRTSLAATEACLREAESTGVPVELRRIVAAWAGEHCSIMVDQFRRTRLPDWTAWESHDFAQYVAEQNEYSLNMLLNCLPEDTVCAARSVVAEAMKPTYRVYVESEEYLENASMAFFAGRMTEYAYGDPAPWNLHTVPMDLTTL